MTRELTSESLVQEYRTRLDPISIFIRPSNVDIYKDITKLKPRKIKELGLDVAKAVSALSNPNLKSAVAQSKRPELHALCKIGDLATLKKYFASASASTLNSHNESESKTPLICASISKSYNVAKWLLDKGVRLNDVDNQGRTAAHWAAYFGCVKVLELFIAKGCYCDVRDKEGRTPLHLCTGNFDTKCLKLLLKTATENEINECDNEGMIPLHWAVLHDRPDHVKMIIKHKSVDVRASDIEGKIPLHLAFSHRLHSLPKKSHILSFGRIDYSCAELLLNEDPGMINESDLEKRTTLHIASGENNIKLVDLLTGTAGCNINTQDGMKRTALHWAAVAGYTQLIELLLKRGADDSVRDLSGATPLHYACSKNHSMCVAVLLSRDGMIDEGTYMPDYEGRHPLIWAVSKGHVQTCRTLLLDFNVDPSARDKQGATALHAAAFAGQTKCAALLIERNVDVNGVDNMNHTPLFRAAERKAYYLSYQ